MELASEINFIVEEYSPMKRGLKEIPGSGRSERPGGVEEYSPMKRGLKVPPPSVVKRPFMPEVQLPGVPFVPGNVPNLATGDKSQDKFQDFAEFFEPR